MMKTLLIVIYTFVYHGPPPNTIKINNLYIDKTEILNIHWMEFLYHVEKDSIGKDVSKFYPAAENTIYNKPEHRYKPIVLITYEQAQAYCAWRSEVVSKKLGRRITYRLPTEKEWLEITQAIKDKSSKKVDMEIKKTNLMNKKKKGTDLLLDIKENKSSTFHFFSNVSEMVAEKGKAMGLNNENLLQSNLNHFNVLSYEKPNQLIGFRCLAVMD